MNQAIRAEYWLKCWVGVANSSNCVKITSPTEWADTMLKEFDKRFPNITPVVPATAEIGKEGEYVTPRS